MKVSEIMTKNSVMFCSPRTSLSAAARSMKKANCGALPVVGEDHRVVGIVTDRDICLSLAVKQTKEQAELNIGDILTQKLFVVHPEDTLLFAFKIMRLNKVSRLPVVDQNGFLKGIISIHSLISHFISPDGQLTFHDEEGENLCRTIKALSDRYTINEKPIYEVVFTAG